MPMNVRPISSTEMSNYRYSGRNNFGKDIPHVLQVESLLERASKTIFPCKIFDKDGNLKRVISKQEIIYSEIAKIIKSNNGGHG